MKKCLIWVMDNTYSLIGLMATLNFVMTGNPLWLISALVAALVQRVIN